MKTGILFLAAALALALGGCALQNADFGTVGAAEPRRAEPMDFGDFSNSYLPPGPAFQNGAGVALTQQLIWEAAYDPSVGSPLWQYREQDASDTQQKGAGAPCAGAVGRVANGAKPRADALCHRRRAAAVARFPDRSKDSRQGRCLGGSLCLSYGKSRSESVWCEKVPLGFWCVREQANVGSIVIGI